MRHFRTYLLVTLLLLAAGQGAKASDKTVKYCITSATQNGNSYTLTFGLADGSDTPFDGSTTYSSVTVNTLTATDQTVTLGDGFSLRLQWAAGTSSDRVNIADTGYGWNINANNTYVTYTVLFSSSRYFATHLDMQNSQGNEWMSDTGGHVIAPDFNYVSQLEQSYDSRKMFGRLVVKYTDTAPITVLTSPSTNTYNITSQHDLAVLASYVNGGGNTSGFTFLQTADIIFTSTTAWNDASSQENNYTAIGTSKHRFQGTFDGQNHTIRGICLYQSGKNFQGLFGCIGSGGIVKRINLAYSRITGCSSVGGIAGGLFSATVEDCSLFSVCIHSVQSSSSSHGGIVGYSEGTIQRCISSATLSAANTDNCEGYGAIVGQNKNSVIDCIVINATVAGVSKAGAIIGYDSSTAGTIQRNYYRACTVAGTENATGVGVGNDSSNSSAHDITTNQGALALYSFTLPTNVTLERTASTSLPYCKTYDNGADIGATSYSYATASIQLSYTGAPPAGEYVLAVYVNGDIATYNGNNTYTATRPAEDVTVTYGLVAIPWRGDGTADSPWLIERREQLDLLATNVNGGNDYSGKYFLQTADLVYDETENNFVPIGDAMISSDSDDRNGHVKPNDPYNPHEPVPRAHHAVFQGTYDGGGHTISGIRVTRTGVLETAGRIGLFSIIESAGTVKNVVLANSTFTGFKYVGGIAGNNVGTIQNCRVKDDVTIGASDPGISAGICFGGIAGSAQGSVIGCISAASLSNGGYTNTSRFGGIVGTFNPNYTTIRNCLYTGTTIPAGSFNGAIAGVAQQGSLNRLFNNFYTCASVPGGENGSDAEGKAELAATYNFKPVEIGEQTDSYAGLTADELLIAYEHGLSYKGVYYMSNATTVSTAVLTLVQGTKDGVSAYWGTFYDGTRRNTLPEGAAAYTMDSYHHLYRLGDNGRVIPVGVAVVIIADRATINLTPNTDGSTIIDHSGGNFLHGGPVTPDGEHKVPVPGSDPEVKGFPYVLSVDSNGVIGFRQFTGTDAIPAHKAYYIKTQ